jgi:hypothetical protein
VFGGESQKISIDSQGVKNFNDVGLSMTFGAGTYPDGDVWVSRGYINPDVLPDGANNNFNSYTIVNNYGTNMTFTSLEALSFTDNSEYINTAASDYKLYKRESNAFGNTWGTYIDTGDNISGTGNNIEITFSTGLGIDSFSQFALSNENTLTVNNIIDNNTPDIYPNPLLKNNTLFVNIPDNWAKSTMVVYNMRGQKMSQTSLVAGKNLLKLNLQTGIYIITIFNLEHRFDEKLILN